MEWQQDDGVDGGEEVAWCPAAVLAAQLASWSQGAEGVDRQAAGVAGLSAETLNLMMALVLKLVK